jgi:hypothetical protein
VFVDLAGFSVEILPPDQLSDADCLTLEPAFTCEMGRADFEVEFVQSPPWVSTDPALYPHDGPAVVSSDQRRVRLSHRAMTAELDLESHNAKLFRVSPLPFALVQTLRAAVISLLVTDRGVAVHAAATVIGEDAVLFPGISGAGKTSIASSSPFPLMTDELVAVRQRETFVAQGTFFWGGIKIAAADTAPHRIAAICFPEKGSHFQLRALTPAEAARRIMQCVMVPPVNEMWQSALQVVSALVAEVPAYSLSWRLPAPDWDAIADLTWRNR